MQCEAPRMSNLKRHVESSLEGARFTCDQCEYKATEKLSLKEHAE